MNAEALCGKVLGSCTLQTLIGRGGMGAVFLAQQSRPRRQVAVKVLLPMVPLQASQHEAFLKRFQRETDAAASLGHPNIMPVHEYGESEGLAYLVMPYVSGGTLREEFEREGKLPLTQVVDYLEQMADALNFAHERGIIHRDIKPANIMLTPDKRLLLTDFGLAKIIADGHISQNPLSDVGMPMGTPDYMSPEQVVGGEIDARADIYSLGVLTYQMLTGHVPFNAETPMKVAMQHLHNQPPTLRRQRPDLPARAEQVILRTLAKQKAERYASTRAFADEFRQALEEAGVMLEPQATVALPPIQNGERAATNRRRGLFDPVWRNGIQPPTPPHSKPVEQVREAVVPEPRPAVVATAPEPTAQTDGQPSLFAGIPTTPNAKQNDDIVAKTSMTLPSFSGLLAPTSQVAPTPGLSPTKTKLTSITPPPATQDMENSQLYPKPTNGNDQAPGADNQRFSPPRMRFGNKTNLLGNAQPQAAQPAPQPYNGGPGQSGMVMPYGTQPSPAASSAFWSQTGTLNAPQQPQQPGAPTGNGNQGNFNAFPPSPVGNPNSYGGQPPMQSSFGPPAAFVPANNGTTTGSFNTNTFATGNPNGSNTANFNTSTFNRSTGNTGMLPGNGATGALTFGGRPTGSLPNLPPPQPGATGALQVIPSDGSTGQTGMLKLTQSVRVVKVPVKGQPGQYVTGLLPVLPGAEAGGNQELTPQQRMRKKIQTIALIIAAVIIVAGSLIFLLNRPGDGQAIHLGPLSKAEITATARANATMTVTAQKTAEAQANIIVIDPMQTNIHNWFTGKKSDSEFSFKQGTYHIKAGAQGGLAYLPDPTPPDTFVYSLTMQQVNGVDDDAFNLFGLVFRYSYDTAKKHATFYSFQLSNNTLGGLYRFQKYDSAAEEQWSEIWSGDTGPEVHLGKGKTNTLKVMVTKDRFRFFVNGKEVHSAQDGSYRNGQVGMFVNKADTEVAFKDFSLTHK